MSSLSNTFIVFICLVALFTTGPPRLLDLSIKGDLSVGSYAIAERSYIGGTEGKSEYWWIRVKDGIREQVSEPRCIKICNTVVSSQDLDDPRVYRVTEADTNCMLKVKCRPVRSDGHKGEIFTSKGVIVAPSGLPHAANNYDAES